MTQTWQEELLAGGVDVPVPATRRDPSLTRALDLPLDQPGGPA